MKLWGKIEQAFFHPISASGFGLMRIAWGYAVLFYYLLEWHDVTRYYSGAGLLPVSMESIVMRMQWRFTLLDIVTEPYAVFGVYVVFLACAFLTILGIWPRLTTILTTLFLFSFHERSYLVLGGGETVLRVIGFLLMIAPGIDAFSLKRFQQQWQQWRKTRELLPTLTQPAWPFFLLLWQFSVIYLASGIDKLFGEMWRAGTAVAAVLHHPHFARWPMHFMDTISPLATPVTHATVAWEFSWLLLYIPSALTNRIPLWNRLVVRRTILIGGLLFHGGIFLFLDVGSFTLSLFAGYFGLLLGEDFTALRRLFNRNKKAPITVLYDGNCGLCRRSMFSFVIIDHLHRLKPVDFRDLPARKAAAPDLSEEDLDRSIHIRFPDGRTEKGFFAFRALAKHIPVLWPVYPTLFFPGVPTVGQMIYAKVAARRNRCSHENCKV